MSRQVLNNTKLTIYVLSKLNSLKNVSLTCDVSLNDFSRNIPNELFKRAKKAAHTYEERAQ